MSSSTTIRKIGNSLGIILGKGQLDEFGLKEGDKLYVVSSSEGLTLTPYDNDFSRQMETAKSVMGRYRNTLRELSK
ncbi:MAG: hypothetical protein HQL44_10030 [Alphaproteobacteria bacterium]|nr:hypothetical protein [Alphaproteobacteria bacterium]